MLTIRDAGMLRFLHASRSTTPVVLRYNSTKIEKPNEKEQQKATQQLRDFKINEEQVGFRSEPRETQGGDITSETCPNKESEIIQYTERKRTRASAQSFVHWTMNRMLHEMNVRKLPARRSSDTEPTFSSLLRHSTFVQLGNFEGREVSTALRKCVCLLGGILNFSL
ncbi:hypothetical protein FGIG_12219 [Fasciola gigantica]|uniref:Uncharacterized protein n=1 Tax=Fasciola gigantica TaxID=46835 RepID=A0A504YH90_FASGI|nr:hypothetical protein FGIG_12219 [Fasciola gigantica]